jgi:hypothetical protein
MVPILQVGKLHQLHLAALLQGLDPGAEFKDAGAVAIIKSV